jgi:hypothetical protein
MESVERSAASPKAKARQSAHSGVRSSAAVRLLFDDPFRAELEAKRRLQGWDWRTEPPPVAPGDEEAQQELLEQVGGWQRCLDVWDAIRQREKDGEVPSPSPEDLEQRREHVALLVSAGQRVKARRRLYTRRTLRARPAAGRARRCDHGRARRSRPAVRRRVRCGESRGSPDGGSDGEPGEARPATDKEAQP